MSKSAWVIGIILVILSALGGQDAVLLLFFVVLLIGIPFAIYKGTKKHYETVTRT